MEEGEHASDMDATKRRRQQRGGGREGEGGDSQGNERDRVGGGSGRKLWRWKGSRRRSRGHCCLSGRGVADDRRDATRGRAEGRECFGSR